MYVHISKYKQRITWTLQRVDQKYLESFEMWCFRRLDISWFDRVINKEIWQRVKVEKNILQRIKRKKANWICRILHGKCLLEHGIEVKIEGRIEVVGRRGRRRKQLLDDLYKMRGYCKLKEEALDRNLWRTRFGRGNGPPSEDRLHETNEPVY